MDTRMKFLEHELAEQEREMNIKHEAGADAAASSAKSENTEALERKVRELEAMVKGLTEEMLDLKSVTRKLTMQLEEMRGGQSRVHAESRFGQKKPEEQATEISRGAAAAPASSRTAPVRAAPGRRPAVAEEEPAPAARAMPQRPGPAAAPVRAGAATSRHTISSPIPERMPEPEPEVPVEQLKAGQFEYVMQPDGTIQKRKKTTDHSVIIAGTGYNPGHASRSAAIRPDSDAVIEAAEDDAITDDAKNRR
ncbi:hypothetical protein McpAg1_12010 [Methanocorpusculaceae archaeon Ag1]|uniref:Uncharacterized protein n=2 Tax=Methanorbis furvi TaxID=3028299 RepID=A0AAE4MCY9_9EURY|nr:hypothetical protein [Methanocorpusculaceae archaeon Ag1]